MFKGRIENWAVLGVGILQVQCVFGFVYDHEAAEDGTYIRTSEVVSIDGNQLTTSSGSVYKLGKPAHH